MAAQRLSALEAQLQELLDNQQRLENENATLHSTVDNMRDNIDRTRREATDASTASTTNGKHEPKVSSPEYFSGQRNKVTTFITQVKMVIGLQPSRFPTENSKVLYAASYLRDTAFLWFQPYLAAENPPAWLDDFNAFCKELRAMFGDPDEVATAERHLYNLRQRGSASSYVADFTRYAAIVSWKDEALCAQFYRGLKDTIKDELARTEKPKDLKTLKDIAVRIDTRLFERHLERDRSSTKSLDNRYVPRNPNFKTTITKATFTPRPAFRQDYDKRDHLQMGFNTKPPNNKFRGKIPNAEYERRKREGLCLYCGGKGHTVHHCPVAPPSRPQFKSSPPRANLSTGTTVKGSGKA